MSKSGWGALGRCLTSSAGSTAAAGAAPGAKSSSLAWHTSRTHSSVLSEASGKAHSTRTARWVRLCTRTAHTSCWGSSLDTTRPWIHAREGSARAEHRPKTTPLRGSSSRNMTAPSCRFSEERRSPCTVCISFTTYAERGSAWVASKKASGPSSWTMPCTAGVATKSSSSSSRRRRRCPTRVGEAPAMPPPPKRGADWLDAHSRGSPGNACAPL
mmetsp:Transcript_20449/g.69474  ORF Transcript_20449/g.69474 Transcript_20449/m.69474 type:complete len:214 (+) Transcript_20449:649-1290(+)